VTQHSEITAADAERLLDDLTVIVARASAAIMAIPTSHISRQIKADGSAVTAADEASEAVILEALARLMPGVAVVSEEATGHASAPALGATWFLVDPLDGTREFLAGRGEYTVNLALISKGLPIAGLVAAPALGMLWRGVVGRRAEKLLLPHGGGAVESEKPTLIRARAWPGRGAIATVSRSHLDPATEAYLARLPGIKHEGCGSSVKFCQIAQGAADIYPRLAPTSEWDIAAGHAVLAAAGGTVTSPDGTALAYGRSAVGFRVPAFIAWGDPAKVAALKA
jgi:3'(2'), 5'-bisphosphate nucleotidase